MVLVLAPSVLFSTDFFPFRDKGKRMEKEPRPLEVGSNLFGLGEAGRSQPRDDHVKQEYNPHNLVIPAPTLLVGHSKVNLNKLDTGEKELYRKLYRN